MGASLADAEEATRVRRRYLEALEADDYAALPPPVYTRGFVRTYAEYLGLNPKAMADLYRPTPRRETARPTIRPALPHVAIPREIPIRPVLYVAAALAVIVAVFFLWGQYQSVQEALRAQEGLPPTRSGTPTLPPRVPTVNPITVASPSPSPSPSPTAAPSPTAVLDGILLEFRTTSRVYVEVSIDGRPVFADTLASGATRTMELAKDSVVVRASSGTAMEITVNGTKQAAQTITGPVELTWRR
jgi:cytoskeletal protein RodZ